MDWNCRLDPSLPPWRVIKPGMLCPGHFAQLKIKRWGGYRRAGGSGGGDDQSPGCFLKSTDTTLSLSLSLLLCSLAQHELLPSQPRVCRDEPHLSLTTVSSRHATRLLSSVKEGVGV